MQYSSKCRFFGPTLCTVVLLSITTIGGPASAKTPTSLKGAQLRQPLRPRSVSRTQFFRQMLRSKTTLGKFVFSHMGVWKTFRSKAKEHNVFSFKPLITRGCMAWIDTINSVLADKRIALDRNERESLLNARGVFESYLRPGDLYHGLQVRAPLKPKRQSWGDFFKQGTQAKLSFYKIAFRHKAAWGDFGRQLKKHRVLSMAPFIARDIAAWSETIPEVLKRKDLNLKPGQRAEVERAVGFFRNMVVP